MSVWVEVSLAGDVSMDTAGEFMDYVGDYARRFGLAAQCASAHAEGYPGTSAMLDHLVKRMAEERGVPVKQVYDELDDEVRGIITG